MTAPALTQYVTGSGSVTGDMLNSFEQTCDNFAQLRAFVGTTGMQVFARGQSAPNDGSQGAFYWSATAVGPDDNFTVIIPPGAASGGWIRLTTPNSGFYYAADTGTLNALAITLPSVLSGIPIGTVIFVNPAHTTTITNPTLSINGGTPVTITSPLGAALAVGAITLGNPAQIMVGTGHALWLLNPGGSSLGPYATAALGQLPGTTTNDNAGAGDIGEVISAASGVVSLASTVTSNVTSISLTAGDWDVWGNVAFTPAGTTDVTTIACGVGLTSATLPNSGIITGSLFLLSTGFVTGALQVAPTGTMRVSIAATTPVYLTANSLFSVSTMNVSGFIAARRAR